MAFTEAEKLTRITELREEIADLKATAAQLRKSTMESYSFNDGQVSQSVKKRKPKEIREEIQALEGELSRLLGGGNGYIR